MVLVCASYTGEACQNLGGRGLACSSSHLEVVLLVHGILEERGLAAHDGAVDRVDGLTALDLHVAELAAGEVPEGRAGLVYALVVGTAVLKGGSLVKARSERRMLILNCLLGRHGGEVTPRLVEGGELEGERGRVVGVFYRWCRHRCSGSITGWVMHSDELQWTAKETAFQA